MPYYPNGPPLFYIVPPSQSVTIQPNHPYVDAGTGMVFSSYLSEWNVKSNICQAFTEVLYNFASMDPPFGPSFPLLLAPPTTIPEQRQFLILNLSRRATSALASNNINSRRALQRLAQFKSVTENQLQLDRGKELHVRSLTMARDHLRARLQQLRQWHQCHPTPPANASVDDITNLRDMTHHQYLKCVAHDHATSDTLDQMDEVVSLGRLSLENYILRVRRLARAQFSSRALALAIAKQSSGDTLLMTRAPSLKPTSVDAHKNLPHPSVRISVLGQPT